MCCSLKRRTVCLIFRQGFAPHIGVSKPGRTQRGTGVSRMTNSIFRRMLCRLGIHDWYVLHRVSSAQIDWEVACEIDPLQDGEHRSQLTSMDLLEHRHCMICGLEQNQIAIHKNARRTRMLIVKERFGVGAIEPRKHKIPKPPPAPPKSFC